MKTSELIGPALDWAVAKCEGYTLGTDGIAFFVEKDGKSLFLGNKWKNCKSYSPSTDWEAGGPIIEREFIEIKNNFSFSGGWEAWKWMDEKENYIIIGKHGAYCNTPLIAAMRCYVASKLGDEVEIPEELK